MEMRTERIGRFLIVPHRNSRGQVIKIVCLDHVPVAHFNIGIDSERKLAAIELVERDLCNQKMAGKICGFHRNTVIKLLRAKRLLGLEAALKDDRGLKAPYKYVNEVRSHIKKLQRKYPNWTDQRIADEAARNLGMAISRSAVARIRCERQNKEEPHSLPAKKELMDMAKVAEAIDREDFHGRQLRMNFEKDPVLKEKSEEFSKEPGPKKERETERFLIERLQAGERCSFAGGLMHHLFLQEIGFNELVSTFPLNPSATYQSREILACLFHSVSQEIPSIEALKLINAGEMGVLIGCSRSPDKETLREHLGEMAKLSLSGGMIDAFARRLLDLDRIDKEVFFIDGHFLPYYGLGVIAKGYYTVRRMPMKGNEIYAVTDLQGRPLFFITESHQIDFRPIIARSAAILRDFGIERPVLVFDRGGYGIHFFKELAGTADFVTWSKYVSEKSLESLPESSFTTGLICRGDKYLVAEEYRTVSESTQTAKKEGRKEPTSIQLRLVVLKCVDTGKRLGIYTNNSDRPAYDIGYYMLQRWGGSENFYKEMMARFNPDYHPGYDLRELEKQPMVDNPDIALTRKAIQVLKGEARQLEQQILVTEAKNVLHPDKRTEAKLPKLHKALEANMTEIALFEQKLSSLPDKVSILDLLKGKPMGLCDLEKKRLYDLMQFMAFHSRERLVEIFRKCYDDHRDVKQVLDMITTRGGYVKLSGQTLMVMLDWIENKKHREAAESLCRLLNQQDVKMVGRLNLKLFFYVSRIPHHGSKATPTELHTSF